MGGLLSYSGLTTKIRAMNKNFITDAGFREIAELPNVPQVVGYLKHHPGYSNILGELDEENLHRGQVEAILTRSVMHDYASLYRFSNGEQRNFLKMYSRRYEVKLLKKCMANIFDHRDIALDLSKEKAFFDRYSDLDVTRLAESTTIDELIENLKGTGYYQALNRLVQKAEPTLFDYEVALDLYRFTSIWKEKDKILKSKDLELITDAYGNKFDMLNLWWICRAKKYFNMPTTDIYAMVIPVRYKLRKEEIAALVECENMDEFERILSRTYYGRVYENITPDTLEDMYVYVLKHVLLKESRQHPHTAATIYSYLYRKEHDINRLTIAIECIRYGLTPDETMSYIIKT
ncbi:MAG: V-type ATPase subunit [Lachnospiraceae bacterium]|nr:V-type ATPase subunit [Lachnospiraceae bacterium]